ncbi:hypothetical protein HN954_00350 [bacterium]|nr:hypothetical protein [bacterium]MBT6995865.1 hypothetical protein [bacterium]
MSKFFATATAIAKLSLLLCFSVGLTCGHAFAESAPCHGHEDSQLEKSTENSACDHCLQSAKTWSENAIFSLSRIEAPEVPALILASWEIEIPELIAEKTLFLPQDFVFDDRLLRQIRSVVLVV